MGLIGFRDFEICVDSQKRIYSGWFLTLIVDNSGFGMN